MHPHLSAGVHLAMGVIWRLTLETKDSDTKDKEDISAAESSNENDEGAQRYRKTLKNEGV